MWTEQIVLGLIGLSSGVAVAGGLFAFIVELGVVDTYGRKSFAV